MTTVGVLNKQNDYIESLINKETVQYGTKQAVTNTIIEQHEQLTLLLNNRKIEQTDKEILFSIKQVIGV